MFQIADFIDRIVVREPRSGENLIKTERLITQTLKCCGLKYQKQRLSEVDTINILAGNLVKPWSILLTHFDAIGPGALDNASGVAVCLKILIERSDFAQDNLAVFSGSEETSKERPIYWGYGYRRFEQKYGRLLKNCRAIYVVDCVGNGRLHFFQGDYYFHEAVPLQNLAAVKDKLFVLTGSVKKLLAVCHTRKDTAEKLDKKYLEASYNQLVKKCCRN
ncbi:MAG: M28 family peptidase [Candidatus Beckwithbacteria bacterium]